MDDTPTPADPIDELGLTRYRKTIVAVAGAVVVIATAVLDAPAASAVAGVLTALGVYAVPNARS